MCGAVSRSGLTGMLLIMLTVVANGASPPQATIEEIRYTSVHNYTRVIITLSERATFEHFRIPADEALGRPPRLVIDFSPARLVSNTRDPIPVNDGLLKRIRTGQFSPSKARVVLDLELIESYTAFPLYSPYRLIIDVKGRAQIGRTALQTHPGNDGATEKKYTIMIDPGHGGRDPGAVGMGGLKEKTVVLAVSKKLGNKLEARLPVRVLYTRTRDTFVALPERTAKANAAGADLFLSIHANASDNHQAQGVETYYLNNTDDRATIRLASLENGLRHVERTDSGQSELSVILSDLIQNSKVQESLALAENLQRSMMDEISKRHTQVKNLGVKKGPFYVLVGAHMPCVLTEVSFLTHRVQGRLLRTSAYREAIAEGLFRGIAKFIEERERIDSL